MSDKTKLFGAVAVVVACLGGPAAAAWPDHPINLIVVAGAGGGSDFTFRLLARELEKAGQPINVINQAQGGGIVGYTTYTSAKPDGYTLGQLSPYAQFKILGQANFTAASFTPIALVNVDPSAVHVAANSSKLKSLGDIVAALKKDPASLKISCGGTCSASWDIPFVSLMLAEGVDVAKINLIPAQGSAAGLQELASGGIDVVLCSIPETDALKDAGLVKTVGVLSSERLVRYPNVPTAKEATGKDVTGGTWRCVAGPAGMDPALVTRIEAAVHKAYDAESFQKGMNDRGFGTKFLDAAGFASFLKAHEAQTKQVMEALGVAKKP